MRHTRSIAVHDSGLVSGVFNHALDRRRLDQCAAHNIEIARSSTARCSAR
jgi:hypothetical protein